MKTYSDFGWVRRGEIYAPNEQYLFVKDKPKNEEEKNNPFIKTSGGNNPTGNAENFLPVKIREETGISVMFSSAKRDSMSRRRPLVEIEIDENHIFRIWEMLVCSFNLFQIPISGPNILSVFYLNPVQIKALREKGKFLSNHSLVVDQQIMSRF